MESKARGLDFTVNKMNFFNKKQSGLTLIEALVSTAIVGIGFVAIFQMVNFSVQSINTSGERTKANYLVSMIAEDIIGYRNTIYGANTSEEKIIYDGDGIPKIVNEDGTIIENIDGSPIQKFAQHLLGGWSAGESATGGNTSICAAKAGGLDDVPTLYEGGGGGFTVFNNAPQNKQEKWRNIIGGDRYLQCRSDKDIKTVRVYKICRWGGDCIANDNVYDEGLYIGRIQINLNDGKKRKYLYFQADYQVKKE
jgi:Tfp pilus assembly protein PilV